MDKNSDINQTNSHYGLSVNRDQQVMSTEVKEIQVIQLIGNIKCMCECMHMLSFIFYKRNLPFQFKFLIRVDVTPLPKGDECSIAIETARI